MTQEEIKKEIENYKWFIKNTSPTWDELEFFTEQINKLEQLLKKIK